MMLTVAKTAGFCFGVSRAVSLCEKIVTDLDSSPCYMLGPVIHNNHVISSLRQKGMSLIENACDVPTGSTVVIRCHGASKSEIAALKSRNVNIVDATCPDVKKIHKIVENESAGNRLPIIIGQRNHAEVSAIAGWCENSEIFETSEELLQWLREENNADKPISLVFQTTSTNDVYDSCIKIIKKECTNGKYFDTICGATLDRQVEAARLAKIVDTMIVIGDKSSANSLKLAGICKQFCPNVFFIERANELPDINRACSVAITAGASTPAWIIKEVTHKMSEEIKLEEAPAEIEQEPVAGHENQPPSFASDQEMTNQVATQAATEDEFETELSETGAVSPAEPISETDDSIDAEETFEEMLERSIKTLHTGEKVTGVVTSITATEISVELGTKQSGYIPISEFTDDENTDIQDIIKIGDEIEAFVMRVNDVEGMVMLSKKRLDAVKNWKTIEAAKDGKDIVEGVVIEENKGGIVVNVKGVHVFIPASQTGLPKSASMEELLKKKVRLRITEVNQSRRRVVGSIRAVQVDERREKTDEIWNQIEVGKIYNGIVKSMTAYGVFVDIGGVDGMIHISELSWTRIKQPSEIVSIGDEISVYILALNKETRKISLGFKNRDEDPWTKFASSQNVGDVVNVKIVKMMPFGAFAEICPGVDGLIHISQIADQRIGLPSEVLSDGQQVDVKITEIDYERKKVSLSIRALLEPAAAPEQSQNSDESDISVDESVIVYDTDDPPVDESDTESETDADTDVSTE